MARMYLNDQESQVWEQVNLKLQYVSTLIICTPIFGEERKNFIFIFTFYIYHFAFYILHFRRDAIECI